MSAKILYVEDNPQNMRLVKKNPHERRLRSAGSH